PTATSDAETDERRAVLDDDRAHDGVAGADQVAPETGPILGRLAARLPHALQPGHPVRGERDRQNDPRREAAGHRVACPELSNGHGDREAAADQEGRDRGEETPEESLASVAERMRRVRG